MKYLVKIKEKEEKEVNKEIYISYVKMAGCYLGDNVLIKSFYDYMTKISGRIID